MPDPLVTAHELDLWLMLDAVLVALYCLGLVLLFFTAVMPFVERIERWICGRLDDAGDTDEGTVLVSELPRDDGAWRPAAFREYSDDLPRRR